jgi:hypothetical protein
MANNRIIDGWIKYLELKAKSKTGLSSGFFIWAFVALAGALGTVFFLGLSAFVWLAGLFSPLIAALILSGFFLLVVIVAVVALMAGRRSTIERAEIDLAKRRSGTLVDTSTLTTAFEIGRALGWRRFVPLIGIVLLAAGFAKEWHSRSAEPDQDV